VILWAGTTRQISLSFQPIGLISIYSRCLPSVLKQWQGEWTTWVHHALISALITLYAALWGLVLPDSWVVGARLGSGIAFALYGIREIYNWRHHKREGTPGKWKLPYGWGIDGVMDTLGPILIHLWTWTQ
jgi:hypothetical protein